MSEPSRIAWGLEKLTQGTLRARRWVLLGCALLALFASLGTAGWMGFRTSRLDLLNPNSDYNQRWLAYLDEFGDSDDVLVLVAGRDAEEITPALMALERQLASESKLFTEVLIRRDLTRLRAKGLHFVPPRDLERLVGYVEQLTPLARGDASALSFSGRLAAHSPEALRDPQAIEALGAWLASLDEALEGRPVSAPAGKELEALVERFADFDSRPIIDGGGRLGICALRFGKQEHQLVPNAVPIARLRAIVADLRREFPHLEFGVTGMPVLEFDEMQSSQQDMTWASVLSFLGVLLLLFLGYGNVRYSLLAILVLVVGMAWSFGYVTLAIGHLNLLSVSFAAILIGLAIDFVVHFLARFCQLRGEGVPPSAAMVTTVRTVGPGVVTGAFTTACAFFAAGLTDFTGVAELGLVAGGGILVCLIATLVVLPPLVFAIDRRWPTRTRTAPLGLEPLLAKAGRFNWLRVGGTLVLLAVATPGVFHLRYDHNLLNLQPEHLDSVDWEHALLSRSDRSVWFAVSMVDTPEELERLKAHFESLPSVERTEELVTLATAGSDLSETLVRRVRRSLETLPANPPLLPAVSLVDLQSDLRGAEAMLGQMGAFDPRLGALWSRIQQRMRTLPPGELSRRLSGWRQAMVEAAGQRLRALAAYCGESRPGMDDLDSPLRARFVGRTGKHLLRVYARGSIWDFENLQRFVDQVERVDPQVTGHPIQTFYASQQMQRSYLHAAAYAFFAVLIVLMLDFQSLSQSMLAYLPLLLGIWLLLGTLGWLGIPFNPANMIVLPLILGIGIDNGVHVVHDWRSQPRGQFQLRPSVAVAMLICSATTMMGFCSMIFARHQGLRSLGQVLVLGVACCLITSVGFLPALLQGGGLWRTRASDLPAPTG